MKRKFLLVLLLLFLVGAGIAVYHILTITGEYHAGEKTYESIQEFVRLPAAASQQTEEPAAQPDTATQPTREPVTYPEVDFDALLAVNEDVVGWVYIEDTKISYPVLQGEDNRYYVSTMIDGRYNGAGSIFMDYHNAPDFSDRHTILYGHNMQNGTMFAGLSEYRDQEYYDAHPSGLIVTPEKQFRFEIVSAYVASLADPAWQLEFVDDADALSWLDDAMDRSPFVSHYQPKAGDKIITLSTCSYEFNDARFVLVGILMEE